MRPSSFTQETADTLCELIAEGESLRKACSAEGMPSVKTVLRWQGQHPEFAVQFAAAAEARMQHLFDQMTEIAADGSRDWAGKPDGRGGTIRTFDGEHVQRARLRVDTLKWQLSKLSPQKFGDRLETNVTAAIAVTTTEAETSQFDRAKAIASLLAAAGLKAVPIDAVVLLPPAHIPPEERKGYGDKLVALGMLAAPAFVPPSESQS